jgi:threonine synthase
MAQYNSLNLLETNGFTAQIWTYLRVVEKLGITPGDKGERLRVSRDVISLCETLKDFSRAIVKDNEIDIALPTGAMGNMAGGYMSKQMGVPIGKLCAGVNINGELRLTKQSRLMESIMKSLKYSTTLADITHRVIETGQFHKKKIQKTLSDAINIEVVSNTILCTTSYICYGSIP